MSTSGGGFCKTASLTAMAEVLAILAVTDNAPLDWALGAAASFVFVGLIIVPAAVLNSRDRKRRAQGLSQEHSPTP
jgi:hypothetical protein